MYVACDYFQQISTIEMTYFITYTLNHVAHTKVPIILITNNIDNELLI